VGFVALEAANLSHIEQKLTNWSKLVETGRAGCNLQAAGITFDFLSRHEICAPASLESRSPL
jgi:hypothetical protein